MSNSRSKVCGRCKQNKALTEFNKNKAKEDGYHTYCRPCHRQYALFRTYGITGKQYDLLLRRQDGRCGICKRLADDFSTKLAVDHDHATGEIRGLLCNFCNSRLVGRHRRDKGLELFRNAVQYLEARYTGWFMPQKKKKRRKKRG